MNKFNGFGFTPLKLANICFVSFLFQHFNAQLAGFGSARFFPEIGRIDVTTRVMGSLGYLDPEYLSTGRLPSNKVMFQLLCLVFFYKRNPFCSFMLSF